jgi:hypothetical protein
VVRLCVKVARLCVKALFSTFSRSRDVPWNNYPLATRLHVCSVERQPPFGGH